LVWLFIFFQVYSFGQVNILSGTCANYGKAAQLITLERVVCVACHLLDQNISRFTIDRLTDVAFCEVIDQCPGNVKEGKLYNRKGNEKAHQS
jgi:hypothetical protein